MKTRMIIVIITIIMTVKTKTIFLIKTVMMMMMVVHMRTIKMRLVFVMAVMVTTMSEAMLLTTPTAPTMGSRTPSSSQVMRRSLSSVISQLRAELAVSPVLPELLEFSPDILTPHWPAIR